MLTGQIFYLNILRIKDVSRSICLSKLIESSLRRIFKGFQIKKKNGEIEIGTMWQIKTKTIAVIV